MRCGMVWYGMMCCRTCQGACRASTRASVLPFSHVFGVSVRSHGVDSLGTNKRSPQRECLGAMSLIKRCYYYFLVCCYADVSYYCVNYLCLPQGLSSNHASEESMWFKITSQWVFLLMYCKALHAVYINGDGQ